MFIRNTILSIVSLLSVVACENSAQQQNGGFPPPPQVSVAEVISRNVVLSHETSGRIVAKENVQVKPRVGGVIEKVHYREGAIVKKNDLLFTIDQQPFQAELNRADSELKRAAAEVELARVEKLRAQNLVERKLISPGEYDQRVAAEAFANASLESAMAALKLAQLNLAYTEVRSPIDGKAGRALVTEGNLVTSDPTPDLLTSVVSVDPMYVYFGSDEQTYLNYASLVRQLENNGEQAKVGTIFVGLSNEEGYPREADVDFIDNQVNPDTGSIRIRAVIDNSDHMLTAGLFARVKLLAPESTPALLVDDQAILTDQDKKYVYVLGPENKAMRRNIKIGQVFENLRVVTDGLQPGDQVVVYGVQKVFFPGMPVAPQKINMGDPPPAPGPMAAGGH
ncbi:MAG: efflux RND transporter periplasmic adaptor subunit [Gammaproteobacteria bacterium]